MYTPLRQTSNLARSPTSNVYMRKKQTKILKHFYVRMQRSTEIAKKIIHVPLSEKKPERCPQNSPSKALSVRFDVDTVEHTRPDPQHRATEITHELAANIPQHLNRD